MVYFQGSHETGTAVTKHTFTVKIIIAVSILLLTGLIEATADRREC